MECAARDRELCHVKLKQIAYMHADVNQRDQIGISNIKGRRN